MEVQRVNKYVLTGMMTFMLVACSHAVPTDTVESLMAHPDRLREVERKCANSDPSVTAKECQIASEARRRIFMGNGPQYTPPKTSPKF